MKTQTVSMADGYCYIICPDGTVSTMGNNNYGQLGDSTYFNKSTPVKVKHLDHVVAVSAPGVMALKNDGTVWRWSWDGIYNMQQIDIGDVVAINSCHRYMGSISFAIKRDGTLWTWTNNNGTGDLSPDNPVPQLVPGLSDVVSIKCSSTFGVILALCGNGSVYMWGSCPGLDTPVRIPGLSDIKEIATGTGTYIFLRNDGTVWLSGWITSGSCYYKDPQQINITNVKSIFCQQDDVFMIKEDGSLWVYGHHSPFLGIGDAYPGDTPQQVIGIENVKYLSTEGYNGPTMLAITDDGAIWGWGYNNSGELGDSTNLSRNYPEKLALTCISTDCYAKYPNPITVVMDTIVEIGTLVNLTSSASQLYDWKGDWYNWEDGYDNQRSFRVLIGNHGQQLFASIIDSSGCYRYEQFNIHSVCDTLVKVKDRLILDTTLIAGSVITLTSSEAESYSWYPWSISRTNTLTVIHDIESVATLTDENGCERTERFMLRTACDSSTYKNPEIMLDTVTYIGNSIQLVSSPGSQITWQPNTNLSCINCNNPVLRIPGPVSATATITDAFGCLRKEKFIVRIVDCDSIVENENLIILDTLIEPGIPLQLDASEAVTYNWTPEIGLSCSDCRSPVAEVIQNTAYTVTLTDKYHCQRTEQFILTNHCDSSTVNNPVVLVDTITYPAAVISLMARNAEKYEWSPYSGISCQDCRNPYITISTPSDIIATSTDRYGCVFKEKFSIRIRNCDTIILQDHVIKLDTILHYPADIQLHVSPSYNGYNWNTLSDLSCNNCPNPILHASSTASYSVQLFDRWQCSFTEEFRITVLFEEVKIPDLISPNDDGINDNFTIKGLIPGSSLNIFNNNGIVVFHSDNYANDWKGMNNKGERLPDGTYWYIFSVPGSKTYQGWVYIKTK